MDYICDICGKSFTPIIKRIRAEFWDIPYPNCVRVEIVYTDSLAIHSFKTCQECAGEVISYIYRKKREASEKGE